MLWDDLPRAPHKRRSGGTPDTKFPGGHRSRVTPVPIPNTEVKPATADGTARAGGWESRSLPGINCTPRFIVGTRTRGPSEQSLGPFLCTSRRHHRALDQDVL